MRGSCVDSEAFPSALSIRNQTNQITSIPLPPHLSKISPAAHYNHLNPFILIRVRRTMY